MAGWNPPPGGTTLTEILGAHLRESPDRCAVELVDKEGNATSVTVGRLLGRAMAYAARYGPRSGEPRIVGVCLYHSLDLLAAFLGGLWAGHIPTMLAPPSLRMEKT